MKNKTRIVYIIPTYNERENITPMLQLVNYTLNSLNKYTYKILVVDDNSPDGTGIEVSKFMKKNSSTLLLTGPKRGLGRAMIRGYKYAIKSLKPEIIISNEADFSYDPAKIKLMIKKLEVSYDVVLGSRNLGNTSKWPLTRRIIHFIANTFFAGFVAGVTEVEDHNSAFKAIRVRGVLDKINFERFPEGFSFFNYLTFKLSQKTSKIYEFKTTFRPRTKGVSKMMMRDSIEYIVNCFRIRYEKITK